MIQFRENERIILLVHKHWFVMARSALAVAGMLLVPFFAGGLIPFISQQLDAAIVGALAGFGISLYLLWLCLFCFLTWMDYYLDIWIVTDRRIIDVNQSGLFSRKISEVPIASVQDVTIDVHGIIETLLHFGDIRIQTAGEREFTIDSIPRLYEVKDAILKYAHTNMSRELAMLDKEPG